VWIKRDGISAITIKLGLRCPSSSKIAWDLRSRV